MTEVQVQDPAVSLSGKSTRATSETAPAAVAPQSRTVARPAPRTAWPHTTSGRSVIRLVELAAVVALAFLALDFVFHAIGALNVGFAGLTFTVGSFLASPFVGILQTTSATNGNLFVWADVLAMGAYAVAAIIVSAGVARVARSAVRPRA
ncbi:MAG: hypothetical protein ABR950_02340 [Candidatus Dormibacteria bacterium]